MPYQKHIYFGSLLGATDFEEVIQKEGRKRVQHVNEISTSVDDPLVPDIAQRQQGTGPQVCDGQASLGHF
uniref:Uncharacterized protein n=1 Tax=Solanum lycopersicum TaxID=4081 RepID=A0A3Q7HNX7_SOLLC